MFTGSERGFILYCCIQDTLSSRARASKGILHTNCIVRRIVLLWCLYTGVIVVKQIHIVHFFQGGFWKWNLWIFSSSKVSYSARSPDHRRPKILVSRRATHYRDDSAAHFVRGRANSVGQEDSTAADSKQFLKNLMLLWKIRPKIWCYCLGGNSNVLQ